MSTNEQVDNHVTVPIDSTHTTPSSTSEDPDSAFDPSFGQASKPKAL